LLKDRYGIYAGRQMIRATFVACDKLSGALERALLCRIPRQCIRQVVIACAFAKA
jgi:hypothetical protein